MTARDGEYMARALQLARRGLYSTSPNPRVGCVITRNGEIVAEGWHRRAGEPHAEIEALRQLDDAHGTTAYVSLEPCSHHGRTPPCCDALIEAGVARVVVATEDPNPQVAGSGIARLRESGIIVDVGLLAAEAEALNRGFIKRMRSGLPWIHLKLAMSLDGRTAMASGESQWITGAAARADVQRLRAQSCAVLSGIDTVLQDNAALTVRPAAFAPDRVDEDWRQPLRVVVDSQLRLTADSRLLQQKGGPVLVATASDNRAKRAALEATGAQVLRLQGSDGRVDLHALLKQLAQRECNEVLVEAGATLAGALLSADLVDALTVYMAPTLLGSAARPLLQLPFNAMSEQRRLHIDSIRAVGDDWRIDARPVAGA